MAEFPQLRYSIKDVERAGNALRTNLVWSDESKPSILRTFKVANNWLDSHALPMRGLRREMQAHIRRHKLNGITGARLKRMPSIRRKLLALPSVNLNRFRISVVAAQPWCPWRK